MNIPDALVQAIAQDLSAADPSFEDGAIGASIVDVRFRTLRVPRSRQQGQQPLLTFWAWGDDEAETLANLDRTLILLSGVLRALSDEISAD